MSAEHAATTTTTTTSPQKSSSVVEEVKAAPETIRMEEPRPKTPEPTHLAPPIASEPEKATSGASSVMSELEKQPTAQDQEVSAGGSEAAATRTASRNVIDRIRTAASHASVSLPQGLRLTAIMVALALSMFLVALDMTIIATAIPRITQEFNSIQDIGWYGSAFFLTVASFQSTWGKAYRYFPLKTSFLLSIFIFEVGSLICGVAKNSVTLIVGRAIAGLGGAGVASGVYTIIAFSAEPDKRAALTGILGAVYGVASVIGPLLGGVFTEKATWRWAFYVNLPIGGVSAAIIVLTFHAPPGAKPAQATWTEKLLQLDVPGTFVILCAVICFLLAIQRGGVVAPWNDSQVIGLLVGFGLLVILFIVIQYFSGSRAIMQGRLLRRRNIAVVSAFTTFFAGSFFVLLYYLPFYFQSVDGISPSDSGVRNLPLVLGASIFSIASGLIISATGYWVPVILLGGILTSISAGLLYTLDIGSGPNQWIGYQLMGGIGIGLAIQVPVIVGQSSVEMADISTVTAMILFFQTIGGVFVQAGQAAFTNELLRLLPQTAPTVNPQLVLSTGASDLGSVFGPSELPGVLQAYMGGLRVTYALAIAMAGLATVIAVFGNWRSIKGKTGAATGAA